MSVVVCVCVREKESQQREGAFAFELGRAWADKLHMVCDIRSRHTLSSCGY